MSISLTKDLISFTQMKKALFLASAIMFLGSANAQKGSINAELESDDPKLFPKTYIGAGAYSNGSASRYGIALLGHFVLNDEVEVLGFASIWSTNVLLDVHGMYFFKETTVVKPVSVFLSSERYGNVVDRTFLKMNSKMLKRIGARAGLFNDYISISGSNSNESVGVFNTAFYAGAVINRRRAGAVKPEGYETVSFTRDLMLYGDVILPVLTTVSNGGNVDALLGWRLGVYNRSTIITKSIMFGYLIEIGRYPLPSLSYSEFGSFAAGLGGLRLMITAGYCF